MNIFVLDEDPVIAARYLCDKHVVKMIVESFQLLSTVQRKCGNANEKLYKSTHEKHPCVIWLLKSKANYRWLVRHVDAMHIEYKNRYEKFHSSYTQLWTLVNQPPLCLPDIGLTEFVLAMPDKYKSLNVVESYRKYYICEKLKFARWTQPASIPFWIPKLE